ncbi:MAG: hypothetical protein Q3975_01265 [Oscillospiraceae bacterium]|nr:hypothetical protein [Oscillospiraceae bacterium]
MKKHSNKKIKTRIIAGVLSVITVFSVGSVAMTSASAVSVKGIAKDLSSFAITKTIDKFVTNSIGGSLLKMGAGYLLEWVFSGTEEKQPTVKDAIKKIDELKDIVKKNHEKEMDTLKVINKNIDTKDFRQEADSIHDDYQNALAKIHQHSDNITKAGEGVIDATTYGAYKEILNESSCNISNLEKNFNKMKEYVLGERHSTDKKCGYEATTDYLYKKLTVNYEEKAHSWKDSKDYLQMVQKDINGEISNIHFEAEMDYITILMLNNMKYKVKEYEIQNGIKKLAEGEKPYAYFQNFETDLSKAMGKINEAYKKAIDNNLNDGTMVGAIVKLAEPVDGIQEKGFHDFSEAWAQASATGKNFTITMYADLKADKDNGFNFNNLDWKKYGFSPSKNFNVKDNRTITIDLGKHTIDNTARSNKPIFGCEANTNLTIKNGTLLGGSNAIRNENRNNVTNKLDGVTIDKTTGTGIFMGQENDKNIKLDLTKCTIKNAGNSGVILLPRYGDMTVTGCNFENNSAKYGGGIYTQSINQVVVTDSNFKNNKAWKGGGGAIVAQSHTAGGSTLKIVGGLFEGNSSNLIIDDKYAQTNEDLKKGWGGAVWGENLTVEGATFKNNSTNDQAGAIFVSSGMENWRTSFKTSISNCTFEGNKADHVGGAIRVFHIGDRNFIKNCKFSGNSSRGADIFVEYGHGIGDKFFKDWGNTTDANNNSTVVVNK